MKTYLIVACAAAVLVGCARHRGGVGNDASAQTGYDGNKMPKSSQSSQTWTNSPGSTIDRNSPSPEIQSPSDQKK
jgi:hypothetical protein